MLWMPHNNLVTIHSTIPGATWDTNQLRYQVPCSTDVSLSFVFDGEDYNFSHLDYVGEFTHIIDSATGERLCWSNILDSWELGLAIDTWLVGAVFLKNVSISNTRTKSYQVYTVFDFDGNRGVVRPSSIDYTFPYLAR
jgi:cathepsin D